MYSVPASFNHKRSAEHQKFVIFDVEKLDIDEVGIDQVEG